MIANLSSPRTLPSPSYLYLASSSLNHTHPHDRRTSFGSVAPPLICPVVGLPFVAPVLVDVCAHEHLSYVSVCTAPTTIRTLNGMPSPPFPFSPAHALGILLPCTVPLFEIPNIRHIICTWARHTLAGLALWAPCARIPRQPLRSCPCGPTLGPRVIIGPSASASADLFWVVPTGGARCIRRGLFPNCALHQARRHISPPAWLPFFRFWFSAFVRAFESGVVFSMLTSIASAFPSHARARAPFSSPVPVFSISGYFCALAVRPQAGGGGGWGQAGGIVMGAGAIIQ